MRLASSIEIDAPPEKLWELMCDPARYPDLDESTERFIDVSDGEFGVGSVYREYGGIAPFKSESEWTVVELELMRRQVHDGTDGHVDFHLVVDLTQTEAGTTRVDQSLDITGPWYLTPINALLMMKQRGQRAMDRSMVNVKRLVEGR
ncbi:MAG: SRPBCC family protein [Acidimicrobiia bacterium]|nr:SRPBCC family protein [Acidimicrobiia bacterium]NNL68682.1 SRPBCC family protein [Acidimicrobiia bacterium]